MWMVYIPGRTGCSIYNRMSEADYQQRLPESKGKELQSKGAFVCADIAIRPYRTSDIALVGCRAGAKASSARRYWITGVDSRTVWLQRVRGS